jgi:hypothetical protein
VGSPATPSAGFEAAIPGPARLTVVDLAEGRCPPSAFAKPAFAVVGGRIYKVKDNGDVKNN